jgi:hypothetical protein
MLKMNDANISKEEIKSLPVRDLLAMNYTAWKQNIPFLYDYFINHNLTYRSPCVEWHSSDNQIYFSESDDKSDINSLLIANVKVRCFVSLNLILS